MNIDIACMVYRDTIVFKYTENNKANLPVDMHGVKRLDFYLWWLRGIYSCCPCVLLGDQ